MSQPQPCAFHRETLAGMARSHPRLTKRERAELARQLTNACCNHPRAARDG